MSDVESFNIEAKESLPAVNSVFLPFGMKILKVKLVQEGNPYLLFELKDPVEKPQEIFDKMYEAFDLHESEDIRERSTRTAPEQEQLCIGGQELAGDKIRIYLIYVIGKRNVDKMIEACSKAQETIAPEARTSGMDARATAKLPKGNTYHK